MTSTASDSVSTHLAGASKTRWQEHQRRLKQVSNLMAGVRKPTKNSSYSGGAAVPSWRKNTLSRLIGAMRNTVPNNQEEGALTHDPDVIGEFDRDVSEAMVTIGGRVVGLDPQELMGSQGLRKLVARNIRWFQNTPDWLKLIGLVVAKRLNSAVRTATNPVTTDVNGGSVHRIEGLDEAVLSLPLTQPPVTQDDAASPMMVLDIPESTEDESSGETVPPPTSPPPAKKNKKDRKPKSVTSSTEEQPGETISDTVTSFF